MRINPDTPIHQIRPTLFVGLGGQGGRTIDRIALRAQNLPHWENHLERVTKFIAVDVSANDLSMLRNIRSSDRINLYTQDLVKAYKQLRHSVAHELDWIKSWHLGRQEYYHPLYLRLETRFAFYLQRLLLTRRLEESIRALGTVEDRFDVHNLAHLTVHMVGGLSGAMSSGTFLSIASLLQSMTSQLGLNPLVFSTFTVSTALEKWVSPDLMSIQHSNSYASLKELEFLNLACDPLRANVDPRGEEVGCAYFEEASDAERIKTPLFATSFLNGKRDTIRGCDVANAIGDATFLQWAMSADEHFGHFEEGRARQVVPVHLKDEK